MRSAPGRETPVTHVVLSTATIETVNAAQALGSAMRCMQGSRAVRARKELSGELVGDREAHRPIGAVMTHVGHAVPIMVYANQQSDFAMALASRPHETVGGDRLEGSPPNHGSATIDEVVNLRPCARDPSTRHNPKLSPTVGDAAPAMCASTILRSSPASRL